MELKVHCDCGQKFKFAVEPVNHQMPFTVACPICHRDGTEKANAMLQQMAVFTPIGSASAPAPAPAAPPPMTPAAPPPFSGPRASSPIRMRVASPTPATEEPSVAAAASAVGVVLPPIGGRSRMARETVEPPKKTSFGMGLLGGLVGALVGSVIYYLVFKTTGVRIGMALLVGGLAGVGAQWLGKGEGSTELGGITAVFVVVGVLAAQYFVILGIWNGVVRDRLDSGYSSKLAEAQEVVKAIPTGSDAEIRLYLAKQSVEAGETAKPSAVSDEEVQEFREKSLPEYQDLTSGKLTKEAYLVQSGHDLAKLKQFEKTEDGTFKALFILFTLNLRSIISLVVGAGLAFKLSTNA